MVLIPAEAGAAFEPVTLSLAYRLGEVTLFDRKLVGLADRRHFLQQPVCAGPPEVPQGAGDCEFFFFPTYPVEAPPAAISRRGEWIVYTPYTFRNYFVDLRQGGFDDYLAKFSGKTRTTLRKKLKRVAEASGGAPRFSVLKSSDEVEQFMAVALPLSERTYQARLLDAGLPTSREFAAHLQEQARAGAVRGYLLYIADKPAAYVLCFCRQRVATYDYVGFDPDLQALSPGTVLQYLVLEALFQDPDVDVFDFTEGEGAQKQLFATDHRLCAKTYVLKHTASNVASVRLHQLTNSASKLIGRVLQRFGLKDKVRRLLRRTA